MDEHSKIRVLIVEDANLVRRYYRETLEVAGYEVEEALNGSEALEKLMMRPADLLIVDVNMPQMDGFTFLRTLRGKDLPLSSIPALIASTESEPQDFAAGRAAGGNFYITKPVTPEKLTEYVALLSGRLD